MTNPQDKDELDEILHNYRALIADMVEDRHSRGVSTKELQAIDTEAKSQLTAYIKERERLARLDELEGLLVLHEAEMLFTSRGTAPGRCNTVAGRLKQLQTPTTKYKPERNHMSMNERYFNTPTPKDDNERNKQL